MKRKERESEGKSEREECGALRGKEELGRGGSEGRREERNHAGRQGTQDCTEYCRQRDEGEVKGGRGRLGKGLNGKE